MEEPTIVNTADITSSQPPIQKSPMPKNPKRATILTLILLVLLFSGIIATSYLSQQKQDTRSKAAEIKTKTPTITKLYFHHWETGSPTVVQNLPSYYSAFINATYNSDQYIPGKTQEIIGQYVEATNAMIPGAHEPNYPLYYDMMKNNEVAFVHSTNPAELNVRKGTGVFNIYWKYDERYDKFSDLQYAVYRVKDAAIDTKALWNQSWKDIGWEKIATVNASSFNANSPDIGKFMSYADSGYSTSGPTCYLIKTIDPANAPNEQYYSLPVCNTFAIAGLSPHFYFTHSDVKKTKQEAIDNEYANNTYEISVYANVVTDFIDPQVILYGNEGNGCTQINTNQCAYKFREISRHAMIKNGNKATVTLTLRRPYLMYKGGKNGGWTDEPAFRITATNPPKTATHLYPYDGGYLVLGANNKLQNRFWTGYPMNPASVELQTKLVQVLTNMKSKGYNAVFLDNWAPRLFEITGNGTSFEAPAIEFYYPDNWPTLPEFQDPTTIAFDQLGKKLKTSLPGYTLLGNSLNKDIQSVRMLQEIDGGMFEVCFHSGSEKSTGESFTKTLDVLDGALAKGKKVICFPSFSDGGVNKPSPFDPTERIYTLAGYLLIAQNKSTGNAYYGHSPHWASWGPTVNQYPEYLVDIGNPVSAKVVLGNFFWKRSFSNGLIYVNAGTESKKVTIPTPYYNMLIEGVVTNRDASGAITSADPGRVRFEKITSGSQLTIPPGTALILQKSPTNPITTPTISPAPTNVRPPTQTPKPLPTMKNLPTSCGGNKTNPYYRTSFSGNCVRRNGCGISTCDPRF